MYLTETSTSLEAHCLNYDQHSTEFFFLMVMLFILLSPGSRSVLKCISRGRTFIENALGSNWQATSPSHLRDGKKQVLLGGIFSSNSSSRTLVYY